MFNITAVKKVFFHIGIVIVVAKQKLELKEIFFPVVLNMKIMKDI